MSIARSLNTAVALLVLNAVALPARLFAQTPMAGSERRQPHGAVIASSKGVARVHVVTPGNLKVTVVERGIVEPQWTASEYCRVKGGAAISWILPDRTRVVAGQLVCQLALRNESGMIFAPFGGILVYPDELARRGAEPIDEPGLTLRERGRIFTIIDDHGPMQLDVKVHESVIDLVDRGLKARIKSDAFPGELITGTVADVAVLPDPVCFFDGFIKTYTAKVRIDHGGAGLRPNMMAEVEILVDDLQNVLSVPVGAVVYRDGKDRVSLQKSDGQFVWREVTLGQSNERLVEVKQGLKRGDRVAIEPPRQP